MNSKVIFTLIFFSLYGTTICQEIEVLDSDIQDFVESIAMYTEDEPDLSVITEDLIFYLNHPLDLNTASDEDLSRLHILNSFQIKSLRDYIRKNGPLLSIYELPLVFGFSRELAEKVQPFITVNEATGENDVPVFNAKDILRDGRHQWLLRAGKILEKQRGYRNITDSLAELSTNQIYPGSSVKLYSQYRFRSRQLFSLGLTMEKDPGEELFSGSNPYGFDFNSAHLFLSDTRWIDRLAIGDYKVRYGQGLIAWSGFTFNKSPMVMNIMKSIHRIDPYTSTNESDYFRGIAIEKKVGSVRGSIFYSDKNIDANVIDLPDKEGLVVSSLLETGYHRLPRELEDENVLNEKVVGGSFSWNQPTFRISVNGIHCFFDGELQKGTRPYQMYRFSGHNNSNVSFDYRFSFGRFYLFGEEALSSGRGTAFLNGLYGQLTSEMGVVLLHRSYSKSYQALYSGAFSEKTGNNNESGLYMGFNVDLLPSVKLRGYTDAYKFPWLSYLTDGPSQGWDYMMDLEYKFGEKSSANLRFRRSEDRGNHMVQDRKLASLKAFKKTNVRCHLLYYLTDRIILKNRVENVFVHSSELSSGLMFYQDICYKPESGPLGLDFRYAVFDTDGFENRIYAYENDVLYAFSVPAYYGKGYRTYINLKYRYKNTDWWLKLGRTGYTDREVVGTGLNQIYGNSKTSVNFQVRLKF